MRVKSVFLVGLIAICSFTILASTDNEDEKDSKHYFFNGSIYFPVSINQSKFDSANINISLVYGHIGRVNGLDLALISSAVEDGVRGLQFCGIAGVSGADFSGMQWSGLASITGSHFRGMQLSGLFAVSGEQLAGIQLAGLIGVNGERMTGAQLAGLIGVCGETGKGLQLSGGIGVSGGSFKGIQAAGLIGVTGDDFQGFQGSGVINVTGGQFSGLQVGGVINVAGDELIGLQLGSANITSLNRGAQIGLVNITDELEGVQLGLVNYSKRTRGTAIGLVNISRDSGRIRWINWASNISGLNSGIKFQINRTYSIASLGGFNLQRNINQSLAYSVFYGLSFPIGGLNLNTDIGYFYLDNQAIFRSRRGQIDQHGSMLRASMEYDISRNVSIFAGGGLAYVKDRGRSIRSGEYTPVYFLGLEFF